MRESFLSIGYNVESKTTTMNFLHCHIKIHYKEHRIYREKVEHYLPRTGGMVEWGITTPFNG